MSDTKFTVIGAGHGGKAMAAHLALMDKHVTLYNRTPERIAAIKEVFVEVLPSAAFSTWMKVHNKEGGANKFPRVLKRDLPAEWEKFLEKHNFKKSDAYHH